MTRVDKADILELTVYHLTQLQQQQQSVAMAAEVAAYSAGYKACAQEAVSYLYNNKLTSGAGIGSLSNHLHVSMATNSRNRHHSQQICHSSMKQSGNTERHSTPLRPFDNSRLPLPDIHLQGYTPIQNGGPIPHEMTSYEYSNAGLNHSSGITSSSLSSSETSMSCTDSMSSSNSERLSYADDITDKAREDPVVDCKSEDVVSIGVGKENEIGHVIKEIPWRPF